MNNTACQITLITNTPDIQNTHQNSNFAECFPCKITHKTYNIRYSTNFSYPNHTSKQSIRTNHLTSRHLSLPACFGAYAHILVNYIISEYDRLYRNISGAVLFIINNFRNCQLLLYQYNLQILINNI